MSNTHRTAHPGLFARILTSLGNLFERTHASDAWRLPPM